MADQDQGSAHREGLGRQLARKVLEMTALRKERVVAPAHELEITNRERELAEIAGKVEAYSGVQKAVGPNDACPTCGRTGGDEPVRLGGQPRQVGQVGQPMTAPGVRPESGRGSQPAGDLPVGPGAGAPPGSGPPAAHGPEPTPSVKKERP